MMSRGRLGIAAALMAGCTIAGATESEGQAAVHGPSPEQAAQWAETALARPLFSQGRRPAKPAATTKTDPIRAAAPRLAGTMSGPFGKRAVFALDDKTVVAAEGDRVGGWTVTVIAGRSVGLIGAGEERTLSVAFAGSASVTPPVALATLPFWSTPCGRSHVRDAGGNSAPADPGLCQSALAAPADWSVFVRGAPNAALP